MSNRIAPEDLGAAIGKQLELYNLEVQAQCTRAGNKAIKELERITKDTAPFDEKAHHRHFVDCIATKREQTRIGYVKYIWYVKAPCYRLTHLLVHGHETKNGGRTKKDPFLQNALDRVLPEYEKEIEEAVKNG